jgi:inositol oxygenase
MEQYENREKKSLPISDVLDSLNDYLDPSDPDCDLPNIVHAYQTAERIRKDHPNDEALQITGLIHDCGKFLYTIGEPDWCVVGDIHPVGCWFSQNCVYSEFFTKNPDNYDLLGIYKQNCGLDALIMTWGHDEYLYRVLNDSQHNLPIEYRKIIRFHSFYPLHGKGAYTYFVDDLDWDLIHKLKLFSSYDLYSKHDEFVLTDEIKEYYKKLLDKYFPEPLLW